MRIYLQASEHLLRIFLEYDLRMDLVQGYICCSRLCTRTVYTRLSIVFACFLYRENPPLFRNLLHTSCLSFLVSRSIGSKQIYYTTTS